MFAQRGETSEGNGHAGEGNRDVKRSRSLPKLFLACDPILTSQVFGDPRDILVAGT